jgi:hypothetical protein
VPCGVSRDGTGRRLDDTQAEQRQNIDRLSSGNCAGVNRRRLSHSFALPSLARWKLLTSRFLLRHHLHNTTDVGADDSGKFSGQRKPMLSSPRPDPIFDKLRDRADL